MGPLSTTNAISSHCVWPCDKNCACFSKSFFNPTNSAILSIFSWSLGLKKLIIFLKKPKLEFNATYKFSFTVNSLKTLGIWNFLPTPFLEIRNSSLLVISSPLKIIFPFELFVLPHIMSSTVVFPAPLGPIKHLNSPALTPKLNSFTALKPSKFTSIEFSCIKFSFKFLAYYYNFLLSNIPAKPFGRNKTDSINTKPIIKVQVCKKVSDSDKEPCPDVIIKAPINEPKILCLPPTAHQITTDKLKVI